MTRLLPAKATALTSPFVQTGVVPIIGLPKGKALRPKKPNGAAIGTCAQEIFVVTRIMSPTAPKKIDVIKNTLFFFITSPFLGNAVTFLSIPLSVSFTKTLTLFHFFMFLTPI
jgi:hypothetical protein